MSLLEDYVKIFKSLSDEFRLNILSFLYENGEQCVCDICEKLNVSQSNISYHLKILCDANIINKRKVAVWNYYSINKESEIYDLLLKMLSNIKQSKD